MAKSYQVGDCVDGVISGIVSYGVFVRFGPKKRFKGLLHIRNISHDYLPSEYLSTLFHMDQSLTVRIIRIDEVKKHVDFALTEMI